MRLITHLRDYFHAQFCAPAPPESNLLDKAYVAVSPMKSTKCKFANLVVSRKIASWLTNLEGLTRMEQGKSRQLQRELREFIVGKKPSDTRISSWTVEVGILDKKAWIMNTYIIKMKGINVEKWRLLKLSHIEMYIERRYIYWTSFFQNPDVL